MCSEFVLRHHIVLMTRLTPYEIELHNIPEHIISIQIQVYKKRDTKKKSEIPKKKRDTKIQIQVERNQDMKIL